MNRRWDSHDNCLVWSCLSMMIVATKGETPIELQYINSLLNYWWVCVRNWIYPQSLPSGLCTVIELKISHMKTRLQTCWQRFRLSPRAKDIAPARNDRKKTTSYVWKIKMFGIQPIKSNQTSQSNKQWGSRECFPQKPSNSTLTERKVECIMDRGEYRGTQNNYSFI
jgi:hypothetical protein